MFPHGVMWVICRDLEASDRDYSGNRSVGYLGSCYRFKSSLITSATVEIIQSTVVHRTGLGI
jgi:hypothetical protein